MRRAIGQSASNREKTEIKRDVLLCCWKERVDSITKADDIEPRALGQSAKEDLKSLFDSVDSSASHTTAAVNEEDHLTRLEKRDSVLLSLYFLQPLLSSSRSLLPALSSLRLSLYLSLCLRCFRLFVSLSASASVSLCLYLSPISFSPSLSSLLSLPLSLSHI